ncbi:MAG: hypothetical protein L6Q34_02840 [Nitrospira sp.]|nr:hypothetical protein [Nitrospira sp. NTP2]MCK6492345.1 hypothetical protein [Nitrospira sp.]RIK59961.1 MAG: hypothetical protein DCC63_05225 [Nitrospira sp.]
MLVLTASGLDDRQWASAVEQEPCVDWQRRHPEWLWCDDFERDRLSQYFEYDQRHGRFVREAGIGVAHSMGMRAEYLPGDPHGGFLHLAFGKTPSPYIRPVDAGTARYREIYWRFDLRLQPGWVGGGADKLTRATILSTDRFAQAAIGHLWSGARPDSDPDRLYLDPASGTDEFGRLKTTTYNDFPRLRWLGADGSRTALFDASHLGRWLCIEVHMKLNSRDADDGVLEFWVDDRLEAQRTGLNWIGAYDDYGINAVYLEQYWTSVPFSQVQQRYWDNFVVSTARIGCALSPPPASQEPHRGE